MKSKKLISILKIVVAIGSILLFVFIHFKEKQQERVWCEECRKVRDMEISAIVDSVFTPFKCLDHITFNNGLTIDSYLTDLVYLYVSHGDSIYKPAGAFKYFIYKHSDPDSCIILERNYDCSYECNDCILYQEIKDKTIQSVVLAKAVRDGEIMFRDNYLLHRDYTGKKIEDYVSVGDSIYKPSGLFKYYIYKQGNKDNPVIVEGDCGCDD
ncbi:MAG: hypothetical protein IKQ70_15030 [Bacteroidales bacterium]|nr:hypothetical protein [Bacteroidales bacterium]